MTRHSSPSLVMTRARSQLCGATDLANLFQKGGCASFWHIAGFVSWPTTPTIAGLLLEKVARAFAVDLQRVGELQTFPRQRLVAAACKSCPQRGTDFGGCRWQAALLTGDAANTDPACSHLTTSQHRGWYS